jgi:phage-related protein
LIVGLVGTLGLLAAGINAIVTLFVTLGPLIAAIRAGFLALTLAMATNPFTGLALLITGVIVATVALVKNWDAVTAAFRNVGSAISSAMSSIRDAVGNVIGNVTSSLGHLASSFFNMGKDIITGLVNGIISNAMAPINAVKNVATNLVNTFKSFFKIGSPSKLFAGYGKNIVEGLSGGIDNAQQLAISSLNSMSARLASPSFNFAGAGGGAPVNVTINAGVGTDPYELGRVVSAALDKYQGVNGRR